MNARLRSWWQYIRKHWVATIIIVFVGVIVLIVLGYMFKWDWTGLNNGISQITITNTSKGNYSATISQPSKSLWDWLQLLGVLAIPVVVGLGTIWFTQLQQQRDQRLASQRTQIEQIAAEKRAQNERDIALDNQREAALQEYINRMSELLLQQGLRDSSEEDKVVRRIAHVRTLTVLRNLDPARKASVLVLLKATGLINKENGGIVPLEGADFSRANLGIANLGENLAKQDLGWKWMREHGFSPDLKKALLRRVNLRNAQLLGINLNEADLSEAYLSGANLVGAYLAAADLHEARLRHTHLQGADLTNANLQGAILTTKQLDTVKSLKGAIMPDGTVHP